MSGKPAHETIEALSAYVDNEVSAAERSRIEAHLAACVDCASRKTLLERASASLRTLPAPEPTVDEARRIRQGVLERVARGRAKPRLRRGLRPVWAGAGMLVLLIVALIAGSALFRGSHRRETTAAQERASGAGAGALAFDSPRDVRSFVSADAGVKQALDTAESLAPAAAGAAPAQEGSRTTTSQPQPLGAPAVPGASAPLQFGPRAPAQGKAAQDAAAASPAPPTTMQAPGDSSRNQPRAAGPERSSADCQAERQADRADIRLATTRSAVYAGQPAWLLVYSVPAPAPGSPEQVAVYVVTRADCTVLSSQVFPAP